MVLVSSVRSEAYDCIKAYSASSLFQVLSVDEISNFFLCHTFFDEVCNLAYFLSKSLNFIKKCARVVRLHRILPMFERFQLEVEVASSVAHVRSLSGRSQ